MRQWSGLRLAGTVEAMLMQPQSLNNLSAEQLREMLASLMGHVSAKDAQIVRHQTELKHSQALCAKLTHENALLKRMKFAAQSERFNAQQRSLLEDEIEADLAALAVEIGQLQPPVAAPEAKQQPKRPPLPATCPGARSATSPIRPLVPVAVR